MAKVRSPNYPAISLADAINRVRAIYESEHMGPAPREAVAKVLGYGGLNGASLGLISALIKYGLLEAAGNDLKVSEIAQDILLRHKGGPERAEAVRAAATLPALFNELHNQYGDRLPSDHTLTIYLNKKGFNPNSVAGVIRVFRDTMEFVNEETLSPNGDSDDALEPEAPMTASPSHSLRAGSGIRVSPTADPVVSFTPLSLDASWGEQLQLRLAADTMAHVTFKGDVTQEAIHKLIKLLELQADAYPSGATSGMSYTGSRVPIDAAQSADTPDA